MCNDAKDDRDILRQCRQLCARGNIILRKFYVCTNNFKMMPFNILILLNYVHVPTLVEEGIRKYSNCNVHSA